MQTVHVSAKNVYQEQVTFEREDDDERLLVLEQHAELDIYSASSLKQQSTCKHTLDDGLLLCSRTT